MKKVLLYVHFTDVATEAERLINYTVSVELVSYLPLWELNGIPKLSDSRRV